MFFFYFMLYEICTVQCEGMFTTESTFFISHNLVHDDESELYFSFDFILKSSPHGLRILKQQGATRLLTLKTDISGIWEQNTLLLTVVNSLRVEVKNNITLSLGQCSSVSISDYDFSIKNCIFVSKRKNAPPNIFNALLKLFLLWITLYRITSFYVMTC